MLFNTEDDIIIYIFDRCSDIDGFENIERNSDISLTAQLIEYSKWLSVLFPKIKKKGKMLKQVDLYNSVSYLEAQVDVLTKIVLAIAPQSNLTNVLRYAENNSVLNIKPLEDVIKELDICKGKLRKKQEDYYGELQE